MEEAALATSSKEIFEQMAVYVAQDCTIYTQDVIDLCTSHTDIEWKSVVLLVPVRLGGETINVNYVHAIKRILADPKTNCIGIIGGKPKHSLYFIGFQANKMVFLDPHYLQNSIKMSKRNFSVSSYHCTAARKISFSKLDPSATIGFYCKTRRDFEEFSATIQDITLGRCGRPRGEYPVFVVTEGSAAITNHTDALGSSEDRVLKVRRHVITQQGTVRREFEEYVVL
ncbi:cysteine protease ATG4D-like [Tropilaelaps mercedesae]|uniref:Cysteine protease n=1 Tax=Tropilaelaps mercedesae TaxID=418985 RepID=A0A1V9X4Q9_9ACAR|nr:cysteine protease ATG4D-like [Tropilaelaps mercedesae]